MTFLLISVLLILGSVISAPVGDESKAEITDYVFVPNAGDGAYYFRYKTSNGLQREETGTVKIGKDNKEYIYVNGLYSYLSDGEKILISYVADEDGYRQVMNEESSEPVYQFPAAALASLVGGGLGK